MKSLQALAALTGILVTGVAADTNPSDVLVSKYQATQGLNDAAKASGKFMGTATDAFYQVAMNADPLYMAELQNKKDWGSMTPSNVMKMKFVEPTLGQFNFTLADKFVALAKKQGAKIRCHNLVWHQQPPAWLANGTWTNATLLAAIDNHITTVMTHFKDDCYSWDVVNEAIEDTGGYVKSVYYNNIGPSFIAHAFNTADKVRKKLGINVKLYYNEYNLEYEGKAKAVFAQQMITDLVKQGVKIDGVGLQGHFLVGETPTKESLMRTMNAYTSLGLDVAFTELDVRMVMPATLEKQQQQTKDYAVAISACQAVARCVGATLWDFDDTYSWIPGFLPGQGFALPFLQSGGKLVRKAAFDGIMQGWGAASLDPTTAPAPTTSRAPTTSAPAPTTSAPTTTTPPGTVKPAPTTAPTKGSARWGQCGGNYWPGPFTCSEGVCTKINDYFYQCV